jgi:hypothetical protein
MNLKEFNKKVSWQKVFAAIFAVTFTAVIFFDATYWNNMLFTSMWLFIGVLSATILAGVMLFAGFTIMKALVHAAASIALIVLLAESYCDLEVQTQAGLDTLKFLLLVGSLYVFYEFWTKFSEACKEYWEKLGDDKRSFNGVLMIVLFVFSVLMFGVALYQVTSPVVGGLCINKPLEVSNLSNPIHVR